MDPIALAQDLIRCPSVTPLEAGTLDLVGAHLEALGFRCQRLVFGEAPDGPVDNLFARHGTTGPHFCFAGHVDVVPPGDAAGWSVAPFAATIEQGVLLGRGAADMKGAIAAFMVAAARHVARGRPGSVSLLLTGDEEGPARFGTRPVLEWMAAHGHVPDHCLVGEPTSARTLGDMIKIGRRGSLNAWITVPGAQGHVGYPALADNPVTRLVRILYRLKQNVLDEGTAWFDPSNLEVTDLEVGNPTENMIPPRAAARLNIRFNDAHSGESLSAWIRAVAAEEAPAAEVRIRISGESFITAPGDLSDLVAGAIELRLGHAPALSTTGGTSDARFIRAFCPVVECGLVGQTMHKADEQVAVADLLALTDIYDAVLDRYFSR